MLREWAHKWGVPMVALAELEHEFGLHAAAPAPEDAGKSEAWTQSVVRLDAARRGVLLWRNNVGALTDDRGVPVRYGLANETKAMNEKVKSADLIGINPVVIQPWHVGTTIGQFVSREDKRPGWVYSGTPHEVAQLQWLTLVAAKGGDAKFVTGPGSFEP